MFLFLFDQINESESESESEYDMSHRNDGLRRLRRATTKTTEHVQA